MLESIEHTGIIFYVGAPGSIAPPPPKKITFDDIEEELNTCIVFNGGDFDTTLGILDNIILV